MLRSVHFVVLAVLILLGIYGTAGAEGEPNALAGKSILAGSFSSLLAQDEANTEYFLGYPATNFPYPQKTYGVYVKLDSPLTQEQHQQLHVFQKTQARPVVLYVLVEDSLTEGDGPRFKGKVLGYGDYPKGLFEPFTSADLVEPAFNRFD